MLRECQASGEKVLEKLCGLICKSFMLAALSNTAAPSHMGHLNTYVNELNLYLSKTSVPQPHISNVSIATFH